jgi:hypothetical protein
MIPFVIPELTTYGTYRKLKGVEKFFSFNGVLEVFS